MGKPTVLVVEANLEARRQLETLLISRGYNVAVCEDASSALARLRSGAEPLISAVVLGYSESAADPTSAQARIQLDLAQVPVIPLEVWRPQHNGEHASNNHGGTPQGPACRGHVAKAVAEALKPFIRPGAGEAAELGPDGRASSPLCPPCWIPLELLCRVACSDVPVVLQGETGSGKEVLARQLHALSPRAQKPFLKVNCAALPSELIESELFGYARGAFTGAFRDKPGKFALADGGTIMLDEIGDMDLKLQAKLLHVLQDQEFEPLGGRDPVRVDVRVMAATHCDLEAAVREGRFRADLYHRLNVICLRVPPLRDRRDEILPLAEILLRKHAPPGASVPPLTERLRRALLDYSWPGNVRELENVMRRYLVLGDAEQLVRELTASCPQGRSTAAIAGQLEVLPGNRRAPSLLEKVSQAKAEAERETLLAALNAARWNRRKAAKILKIGYKALLYRMRKLALSPQSPAEAEDESNRFLTASGGA